MAAAAARAALLAAEAILDASAISDVASRLRNNVKRRKSGQGSRLG